MYRGGVLQGVCLAGGVSRGVVSRGVCLAGVSCGGVLRGCLVEGVSWGGLAGYDANCVEKNAKECGAVDIYFVLHRYATQCAAKKI